MQHDDTVDRTLTALQMATGTKPIETGSGWKACCPAHDDQNPSLSVTAGDDGRVLLHCHAGCSSGAVLTAAGLEKSDLFPKNVSITTQNAVSPCNTRESRPKESAKPTWLSRDEAVAELESRRGPCSGAWTYHDATGSPIGMVLRWNGVDGAKDILPLRRRDDGWSVEAMPEPRPLYCLPDIIEADVVYVVEGEKTADAVRSIGLTATTSQGGSKAAHKSDWSPLAAKEVVIIPDNDEPGRKYAETVASILTRLGPPAVVRIVDLSDDWPDLPDKGDIHDWCEEHDATEPETLRERIEALAATAELETPEPLPIEGERKFLAVLQRFADVPAELLRWLWPGRVPLGMLTVMSGNPGGGKTFVVADLVARITTGRAFPDGPNANGPCDVLFMNLEDHVRVTQKPRLVAADADPDRVVRVECLQVTAPDGAVSSLSFHAGTAAESIRSTAKQLGNLRLVVIDPLASLLASCRSNDAGDVREALAPLVAVAEELGIAIVLVHHNRKGSGTHASERMSGSLQIGATVRMVWEFFRDDDDDERRLFLPGKNSNARDCGGLAFRVVDSEVPLSDAGDFVGRVEWEPGTVAMSADDAADRQRDAEGGDSFPVEWLRDFIGISTVAATEAMSQARKQGISDKQLRNARKALKIKPFKSDFQGGWCWQLPTD